MGALADAQGPLEQRVELGPDLLARLGRAQGRAHLAEDLALADRHGVQAAGHREGVGDRPVLVVDVEVVAQHQGVDLGHVGDRLADLAHPAVEGEHVGVDLGAVAGRHDERLPHLLARREDGPQGLGTVVAERRALEQVDGGAAVRQADDEQGHAGAPPRADAGEVRERWASRRSSDDRSTARTSVVDGTCRVVGAKLRMARTSAATSRSATC